MDHSVALDVLNDGEIDVVGRMPWSSNATFLVRLTLGPSQAQGIYKPMRGERPLWDFEPGLHRREVAAYRLSQAMGVGVVPPTVLRDGPFGEGSLQWFVEAEIEEHYFTLFEQRPDLHDQLRAIALFDLVANNTDRKGGHCLLARVEHPEDGPGRVWAIDNGLCFAADFRLRTVIWEFGGEPIDDTLLAAVTPLTERVPLEVATLLNDEEVDAIQGRAAWLVEHRTFPVDHTGRRYPWPLV
jgi:uncharacterized repeat protein (TIGR03843 family)